ncbi:MAG: glutathione S-transferase N-terminal domain-containing protein [Pseudomonadota bacterium]
MSGHRPVLYGLKLSYFTGKLEGYLRAKGIVHDYVELTTAEFRRCAKATGVAQMPQLEMPDGRWLTDTTPIIAHFEAAGEGPRLSPAQPAAAFISLFLEDLFDEWLWRPALYYRWAFKDDARLMSARIAQTMLRDMKAPYFAKRRFILGRQKRVYLNEDGVTDTTKDQIEALYLDTLDALEPVFAARPFLFGERPCEADFGLFGPMFRHFSIDPTPAAIMRDRAPNVAAWTARLWATTPETLAGAPEIDATPDDLSPYLKTAGDDYLIYLAANAEAVASEKADAEYAIRGVDWRVPASPYRAACLGALQTKFQSLSAEDQAAARAAMGEQTDILSAEPVAIERSLGPSLRPTDRLWQREAGA